MGAIEACRTAALGGHVEPLRRLRPRRDRLQFLPQPALPQVPGAGAGRVARRAARPSCCRFPTSTSSSPCRRRSPRSPSRTRRSVYAILFRAAAETLRTIAADPRHLGAEIGFVAVLHTWGQTLQHHPHVHCVVPGGGLSPDGTRWVACRPGLLPAGQRARPAVPAALPRTSRRRLRRRRAALLRRARSARRARAPSPPTARRCAGSTGSSTPSRPSAAPSRCWPISAATPTASPSPTAGSSP